MSKRKMPEPSTKNGRRSAKNVSNADRLTTAGSASTWPKSGLTVPVSVSPGLSAYFRSRPTEASGSVRFVSGLPASTGCVVDVADDVRHQLEPLRRSIEPQPGQLAERRDVAVGALRQQRPGRGLVQPADLPHDGQPERRRSRTGGTAAARTECGTRRASRARRATADVPHRVPALVVVAVVEPVACPA